MAVDGGASAPGAELTEEVLAVIEPLAREGMTMLLVTHEMNFARRVANTAVFMNEGRVWELGEAEAMFRSPQTGEFRQFLSSTLK